MLHGKWFRQTTMTQELIFKNEQVSEFPGSGLTGKKKEHNLQSATTPAKRQMFDWMTVTRNDRVGRPKADNERQKHETARRAKRIE